AARPGGVSRRRIAAHLAAADRRPARIGAAALRPPRGAAAPRLRTARSGRAGTDRGGDRPRAQRPPRGGDRTAAAAAAQRAAPARGRRLRLRTDRGGARLHARRGADARARSAAQGDGPDGEVPRTMTACPWRDEIIARFLDGAAAEPGPAGSE